jgi:hypothetical protein
VGGERADLVAAGGNFGLFSAVFWSMDAAKTGAGASAEKETRQMDVATATDRVKRMTHPFNRFKMRFKNGKKSICSARQIRPRTAVRLGHIPIKGIPKFGEQ